MKKLLLLLTLFVTASSFAQTIRLEGVVSESGKDPLEMANIMAVNQITKAVDAYAITNDKGRYVLNLKSNTTYSVKITYLGMNNKELTIVTKNENMTHNVIMEAGGIELEGVEIVREMPVSIKGDTIVYNADSFKTGTEKKLEDVLKKLPGVEVNSDGEIEVEGKKVTKLMVEGKDFFDGDTKLGVKNIPADAIDKVQVLRNYNENSILKGVENNQDNIAMNIKLKDGKKNFWFGDMTAGIGVGHTEDRHIINPKIFYYSPKYSINVITNFNNIGELPLTIQDYFKLTGGFRSFMAKGGSNFNVTTNDVGISMLRNNRAKNIDTKFGATNFSYTVTKKWTLSGFGILSSSATDLQTNSQNNILITNNQSNTQELAHQKTNYGLAKLSSSFKPNSKFQFDYDLLAKTSKQEEDNNLMRQTLINGVNSSDNILTNKKQNPTTFNQNLGMYYTQSDKNVFAFEMQHLYQDENPFYKANIGTNPFPDDALNANNPSNLGIVPDGTGRFDLTQNRFVKTNKLDAKLDYYYMVTPKSNINVTVGNTYSYQSFNSNLFQLMNNSTVNDLNDNTKNNVVYNFNDSFIGLHYKVLRGKFTFTPGISAHSYVMDNKQLGSDFKRTFNRFLPDFYALYQIKKAETLTYNFALTNDFTDVNQLVSGYILNNYNSLFRGNRTLENAISQTHSLRYFKYNMFNFENIFANVSYSRKVNSINSIVNFDGVNQSTAPFNSNFANESLSGMGSYGRSFLKHYKASGSTNLSWAKFNNIQGGVNKTTESFNQVYSVKASTNFKSLPNIEVGFEYDVNKSTIAKFYTQKPNVRLDYYFLKSFAFVSELELYHYYNKDKTVNNHYNFWNTSLVYQKKDSKWEYKISGTNILNTKSLNDNNFNQFSITNTQYYVQPRYIILSLKYNL
ncbi:carboxypeptidase regulatory-like domain-containing protein [Flavobacterium sp. SUN046]|uniref:carboxypeptidase regulatory-like domain-containing protein n=1 Tax=Flavobacterium sp. SUN046 TaxID=3002440 RepID=UPI002DB9C603|nr:carboxypeptidase regulatory-like domain-containing protein [Flavobacterium sp. SUN046]MEC4049510.1 carboxypeptidase regulatory-like domain-containing protein [Flavobacterium sp. SUN046]